MIKVTAIIGMILIGLGVLTLGFSDAGDTAAVSNLWADGGFFPKGIGGTLMTLQIVMFAFLAVELVGVTAGESEDPEKTLPKAINTLPWRIGALLRRRADRHPVASVKWTEFAAGRQPLRRRLRSRSASRRRRRHRQLRRADRGAVLLQLRHVLHRPDAARPRRSTARARGLHQAHHDAARRPGGITVSVALMGIGVCINYVVPEKAFDYVVSFATISGMWTWIDDPGLPVRYRARGRPRRLPPPPSRRPGGPSTSWFALRLPRSWSSC